MRRTFEAVLVEQCAPTLAGIKPASLFRGQSQEGQSLQQKLSRLQKELEPSDIKIQILKTCCQTGDCMIYLYRAQWLQRILSEPSAQDFLIQRGYSLDQGCTGLLEQMSRRLCLEQEYPHEIGIFLGYPLEDVVGFIEHRGRNFTCCGYWKVYGNPEEAQKRFDRYRRCTNLYKARFHAGTPIAQLVVAA